MPETLFLTAKYAKSVRKGRKLFLKPSVLTVHPWPKQLVILAHARNSVFNRKVRKERAQRPQVILKTLRAYGDSVAKAAGHSGVCQNLFFNHRVHKEKGIEKPSYIQKTLGASVARSGTQREKHRTHRAICLHALCVMLSVLCGKKRLCFSRPGRMKAYPNLSVLCDFVV